MVTFFPTSLKVRDFQRAFFVFTALCLLSFGIFSSADTNSSGNNVFQDTDQDGLSNDEERLYGTNPNQADTDRDGYSDGAEVRSGYDPLKPAPGDKIGGVSLGKNQDMSENRDGGVNITEEVSKQVATIFKESASNKENLSLEDLKSTIENAMNDTVPVEALPEIDVNTLTIKKQKYSSLSSEERTVKIQADTNDYISAVSYILVSNSPVPMQGDSDIQSLSSFVIDHAKDLMLGNNPALLNDLAQKGQAILEQLKGMTIPENMVDTHIKALKLAQYAVTLKSDIATSKGDADPLSQIKNLSKVQGFITLFSGFVNDIQNILAQNGIVQDVSGLDGGSASSETLTLTR